MPRNPDEIMRRGQEAAHLLENPMLQEGLTAIEQQILTLWNNSETPAQREECYHRVQAVREVRQWFLKQIQAADRERKMLEINQRQKERPPV